VTVIGMNSLKLKSAVVWPGLMNLLGLLLGSIAVAYTLVELLLHNVRSSQNSGARMMVALFSKDLP